MEPSKSSRFNNGSENSGMKYKELISTLPKRENPYQSPRDFYEYQGFWLSNMAVEPTLCLQEYFKPHPSDIFICSSPKTGTTWLKALTFSIMTRDQYDDSTNPLQTKGPHQCVPCLESDKDLNPSLLETELPLLSTHLPYSLLPKSILDSDCKIIYICREPKDTFVSWWHFQSRVMECNYATKAGLVPLEQQVNWFVQGKSPYGPYWDHVSEYWKASMDRPGKIFFLKYEDLKSDTLCYVNKLAEFMGKPFSEEEEKQGIAKKIAECCHFKSLSSLEVNKSGLLYSPHIVRINNNVFFRKGEIGDWKNLLTEDMANSIDKVMQEKFQVKFPQWLEK